MKKKAIVFLLGIFALSLIDLLGHSNGPGKTHNIRSTGAPGETNCGACHTGGTFSGDIFVKELFQQATSTGYYQPGATHLFLVEILSTDTFINGGMQFQMIDTAGNTAGWFLPGNTANSTIAPPVHLAGHQYIEHPHPITPSSLGGTSRIFIGAAWIPSPFYRGPITLYTSGALCDGDGSSLGDLGYIDYVTLYAAPPLEISTDSTGQNPGLKYRGIWGDWSSDHLSLAYEGEEKDLIFFEVFDVSGKFLAQGSELFEPGERRALYLPDHATGIYYVRSSGLKTPIRIQKLYIP